MRKLSEKKEKERENFEKKQAEILSDIPEEFHSYFKMNAWNEGHSYGYQEVIICLVNLLEDFLPALSKYKNRVIQEFLCSKEEK